MARKPDIHVDLHGGHSRWFQCKLNLHVNLPDFVFFFRFFSRSCSLIIFPIANCNNPRFYILSSCIWKIYELKVKKYLTLHVCNRSVRWLIPLKYVCCVLTVFSEQIFTFFDIIYLDFRVFAVFWPLSAFVIMKFRKVILM